MILSVEESSKNIAKYYKKKEELLDSLYKIDNGHWVIEDFPYTNTNITENVFREIFYNNKDINPICEVLRSMKETEIKCKEEHNSAVEICTENELKVRTIECWAKILFFACLVNMKTTDGIKKRIFLVGQRRDDSVRYEEETKKRVDYLLKAKKDQGLIPSSEIETFTKIHYEEYIRNGYNKTKIITSANQKAIVTEIENFKKDLETNGIDISMDEIRCSARIYKEVEKLQAQAILSIKKEPLAKLMKINRPYLKDTRIDIISPKKLPPAEEIKPATFMGHLSWNPFRLAEELLLLLSLFMATLESQRQSSLRKLLILCISASIALCVNLAIWYDYDFYFIHPSITIIGLIGTVGFSILSLLKIKCKI